VCDALVLISRLDDLALVYLAAAARGIPLVCFEGNELAEVVGDGEGGFVVPYLDVAAVADRLAELEADPRLRSRLGRGAVERVARTHGVGRVAERLWDELCEAHR
jgi:glycosyltransferase involved in cell wall biosynthesis